MRTIATLILLALATNLAMAQAKFYGKELIVTASALNLRQKPDQNSKKVSSLKKGELIYFDEIAGEGEYVQVDTVYGQWYKVHTTNNKSGYAFSGYLCNTFALAYEGSYPVEEMPYLNWYGVYARDSFADEIRPVKLSVGKSYNEMFETEIEVIVTNQKDTSKFLIGSATPLKSGYAGPIGNFDMAAYYSSTSLMPGAIFGISPGMENDTFAGEESYSLIATGCVELENFYPVFRQFQLIAVNNLGPDLNIVQNLNDWFLTEEGVNPDVRIEWYGDLDHDKKPDVILADCPDYGCRASIFLSSKAENGKLLEKVCDYSFPME